MKHLHTLIFWKDIKGYEGLYQINQYGQVKSLPKPIGSYISKERILKNRPMKSGYLQVGLVKDGKVKNYLVHRLVAEAFLSNSEELSEVDHINGDRTDNRVSNLQWMSHIENNRKKETGIGIPKRIICVETKEVFETITAAAKKCGVSKAAISGAVKRHGKSAGYHWEEIL